ncbi:uncharacterized protein LOC111401946 isoform X2 [Olea europaea var. sylvestris]|uniref:uncharacterized protein LOC111401946 isoform X2 n=1 Tax=Olea europaea var. sylvestris TaxID=158386 RepID=UPI000C1D4CE2|nr:uncharacterized protein LOC111401946 isoform X2 [Olea europaea var. sylvestris]
MLATAIRYIAKKPKPKMKPIELKTPPEQTQTITRVVFDILKEHGPLTIADTWEHVKGMGQMLHVEGEARKESEKGVVKVGDVQPYG